MDDPDRTMAAPGGARTAREAPWPQPGQAWYTIFVLGLVTTFAQLDLGIVSLLVQPIKRDLGISDFQMSLVLGFSFAVFYTLIGLPISRFIDTHSRKLILNLGLITWSLATALTGLAQNFHHLLLARIFVGAGESVNQPASLSIISDLFPREKLPRAIALKQIGVVVGSAASMLLGAFVIHMLIDAEPVHTPFGIIRGWQWVFICVGMPGLLVALLLTLSVKEPARRGPAPTPGIERVNLRQTIRYLLLHVSLFGPMFVSMAFANLSGERMWMPAFYERSFGWGPAFVGMLQGIGSLVVVPIGLFIGIWLAEHYARRGFDDAPMRVVFMSRLVGLPFQILAPLMPDPWLVLAFSQIGTATVAMAGPSLNAAFQIIAPNHMRGQVTALYMFVFTLIGTGIAPSLTAGFTDFVFGDEAMLKWSIVTTNLLFTPIAVYITWLALKPYGRAVARLKASER